MSVGVNAKILPSLPEAGAASAAPSGDGFAQMLTGIAADPAGGAEGEAPVTALTAKAPATVSDAKASAAVALTAMLQSVDGAAETGKAAVVADTPGEAPQPGVGTCVIELGDLLTRMLHVGRNFGRDAETEGKDAETGEGEASADGETASEKPATETAALPTTNPILTLVPTIVTTASAKPLVLTPAPTLPTTPVAAAKPAEVATIDPAATLAGTETLAPTQPAQTTADPLPASAETQAAKALDLSNFTKLAKPIELAQLRSALQGDTPVKAADASPLAALIDAAAKGSHARSGKPAEAPVAVDATASAAPAGPSALFSSSSIQSLLQPQLGAGAVAGAATSSANAGGFTASADLAVEHQLDIAQDGQWVDRLAKDIARTAGNEGPLRFQLNPEALGRLHIEVAQSHAGTTVRMTAETEAARAVLADAQPRLIAEARAQGVRIAESSVGMNSNGQQADQRRQDEGRHEAFVRTGRAAEPEIEQIEQDAATAAERFA